MSGRNMKCAEGHSGGSVGGRGHKEGGTGYEMRLLALPHFVWLGTLRAMGAGIYAVAAA